MATTWHRLQFIDHIAYYFVYSEHTVHSPKRGDTAIASKGFPISSFMNDN